MSARDRMVVLVNDEVSPVWGAGLRAIKLFVRRGSEERSRSDCIRLAGMGFYFGGEEGKVVVYRGLAGFDVGSFCSDSGIDIIL